MANSDGSRPRQDMTFFRAGTRLNLQLKSTLLFLFCLMQAQWIPITESAHCSMHCSCGRSCCRFNVHGYAAHSSASHCEDHQSTMPDDDCSVSCNCCRTAPQAILLITKAVLVADFSLQAPDAYRESPPLKRIYALSGFPHLLLRPPPTTARSF